MNKANINRQLNCAIYTRKSTDEGLDKEFNSLPRESRFVANISHQHYLVTSDREGNFEVESVDTV